MKKLFGRNFVSFALIAAMLVCAFVFPVNAVSSDSFVCDGHDHGTALDLSEIAAVLAAEAGLSAEDVTVEFLHESTAEELAAVQGVSPLASISGANNSQGTITLLTECAIHSLGSPNTVRVEYHGNAGSYCYYWINAIVRYCNNCSYMDIVSISGDPVYVSHRGSPCIYCGK